MNANHHYFASHAMGFATGVTRKGAVLNLAEKHHLYSMKSWVMNCHKAGEPGVYIWSCKVNAAEDEDYKIEWFQPVGVEVEDGREHFVTYATTKKVAIYNKPKAESIANMKEKAA